MNPEDYESLPTGNVLTHMSAGAIAGVMEHCIMYPLDSVKVNCKQLHDEYNVFKLLSVGLCLIESFRLC